MKKLVLKRVIVFTLLLVVTLTSTALGQTQTYDNEANALHSMGLLQGSEKGFELDRAPNRLEAGVMLIRLLGKEDEALKSSYSHPFKDVPSWANPYVGYLYTNNLTQGVGNGNFGSSNLIDAKSYMTFVLRALGYDDSKGDFSWDKAISEAKELGIINTEEERQLIKVPQFLRGHMVLISHNALDASMKDQKETLKKKLTSEGAILEQGIESKENSKGQAKEAAGTKVKITVSDYDTSWGWGSANYKIDRDGLPPEARDFAYILLSGFTPQGRLIDLSDFMYYGNIERHKPILEGSGKFSDEKGQRHTVYNGATLMYLYGEDQKPIGYGYWEGEKREGTFEVEVKPWADLEIDFEKITSGVTVSEDVRLLIDRSKLPTHVRNFTKIVVNSRYENNLAYIKREALNGQMRGQLSYEDKGIDLININGGWNDWTDEFIFYLYDNNNNILGYSINSSRLIKSAIKKDISGLSTNIKEVTQGIYPVYNDVVNLLELAIIKDNLPKEVQHVSTIGTFTKLKTGNLDEIIHRYLKDDQKKEYYGRSINSSGEIIPNVNFKESDHYILLFDANKNLIGYDLITEDDVQNSHKYFRKLHIELDGVFERRISLSDFNIKRYINGKEDIDFNKTNESSSTNIHNGNTIYTINNMFYEEGVSYEVTSKNSNMVIKSITLE